VLGVLLVAALITAFATGRPTPLLAVGLWLAVVNELEGFTTSLMLREWRCDVPSIFHARALVYASRLADRRSRGVT
jgi:hypothetical protein